MTKILYYWYTILLMASYASKDIVENILVVWLNYIREEEKITLCLEPKNIKDRQKFKVDKNSTMIEKS